MNPEEVKKEEVIETGAPAVAQAPASNSNAPAKKERFFSAAPDRQSLRKKNVRRSSREPRARSEFDQKIITIRRVARVSKGGRRFSFSVAMILGNRHGSVGVGTGKGSDTAIAIDKAMRNAKKNMRQLMLTPSSSIAHRVEAKFSSARIMLQPAPGRGVVAGSAVRSVLELAGIKDITAKIFSPSKNTLNTARATLQALLQLRTRIPRTTKAGVNESAPVAAAEVAAPASE